MKSTQERKRKLAVGEIFNAADSLVGICLFKKFAFCVLLLTISGPKENNSNIIIIGLKINIKTTDNTILRTSLKNSRLPSTGRLML